MLHFQKYILHSNYAIKKRLLFVSIFFLVVQVLSAQNDDENFPPPEKRIEVLVSKAIPKIEINGKLDEKDWELAVPISDFFRTEPRQGGAIRYKTEVKFLHDDKFLYVSAFCKKYVTIHSVLVLNRRFDYLRI